MSKNEHFINPGYRKRKPGSSITSLLDIFNGIRKGNTTALSMGITLLESELPLHREQAAELIRFCLPIAGNSTRIGVTGIPGAGKSTFIESLGKKIVADKKKLAVLAIDPSSTLNKGSILGDKTRMEELSKLPQVYIRPTPSSGSLGGVARATRESIILCEAAGYDYVLVETVGVGQSEIDMYWLTDIFILLLIPGGGDELQGIKRGIMEMADLVLINKAEEERTNIALQSVKHLQNALHYMAAHPYGHQPQVMPISALHNQGVDKVWTTLQQYINTWKEKELFEQKRKDQSMYWFKHALHNGLQDIIQRRPDWNKKYIQLQKEVEEEKLHPFIAADHMLRFITNDQTGE